MSTSGREKPNAQAPPVAHIWRAPVAAPIPSQRMGTEPCLRHSP